MSNNKDKVVAEIYETYDYDKFSFYEENRGFKLSKGYDPRRGIKLQKLINDHEYYDEFGEVTVNLDFKIVNGRHTFEVRKANKMPIRYKFIKHPDFNKTNPKDFFAPINRINKHNSSWSVKNLFGTALAHKLTLALTINDLIKRHKEHFTWVEVMMILTHDMSVLSAWGIAKTKPEIFEDKKIIEHSKSKEFQYEFNLFVRVNEKVRVAYRRVHLLRGFYNIIFRSNLVNYNKLVKVIETFSDNKIKTYSAHDVFVTDLIKQYNTMYGDEINPKAVLMQIKSFGRGKKEVIE